MVIEEIFITALANVGFPIAITIYLLLRFEKIINTHTNSINTHTSSIKELIVYLKSKK